MITQTLFFSGFPSISDGVVVEVNLGGGTAGVTYGGTTPTPGAHTPFLLYNQTGPGGSGIAYTFDRTLVSGTQWRLNLYPNNEGTGSYNINGVTFAIKYMAFA